MSHGHALPPSLPPPSASRSLCGLLVRHMPKAVSDGVRNDSATMRRSANRLCECLLTNSLASAAAVPYYTAYTILPHRVRPSAPLGDYTRSYTVLPRRYYHIVLETLPKLVMLLECANLSSLHDVRPSGLSRRHAAAPRPPVNVFAFVFVFVF